MTSALYLWYHHKLVWSLKFTYIHKQHSLRIHCTYTKMQVLYNYYSRVGLGTICRISRQSGYREADPGSRSYSTFLSNLSLRYFTIMTAHAVFPTPALNRIYVVKMRVKFCCCVVGLGDNFISSVLASFFFQSAVNKHVPILLYCVLQRMSWRCQYMLYVC